jgi:hypothetical protein
LEYGKQKIFEDKPEGNLRDLSFREPTLSRAFSTVGRNLLIHKIFKSLTKKQTRILRVHGVAGTGKTSKVKQAAKYLSERKKFRDGEIWFDLETLLVKFHSLNV